MISLKKARSSVIDVKEYILHDPETFSLFFDIV